MLIQSPESRDHEANLRECFENLRKYNHQLNPDKFLPGTQILSPIPTVVDKAGGGGSATAVSGGLRACPE
ncbi:hypothetical protein LIER_11461 [Lithospermum erythrorhizon]|uniref:Uncharacterized protein n=1 Tax=Lithospermum erythrorhizon TaxID=34254 RepID=A0AAV3PN49_LITER